MASGTRQRLRDCAGCELVPDDACNPCTELAGGAEEGDHCKVPNGVERAHAQ